MPKHLHCVVVIVWFDKTLNKKKLFGGKRDIQVWVSTRTLDDVIHERAGHLVYIRKYLLSSHRIFDQKKKWWKLATHVKYYWETDSNNQVASFMTRYHDVKCLRNNRASAAVLYRPLRFSFPWFLCTKLEHYINVPKKGKKKEKRQQQYYWELSTIPNKSRRYSALKLLLLHTFIL